MRWHDVGQRLGITTLPSALVISTIAPRSARQPCGSACAESVLFLPSGEWMLLAAPGMTQNRAEKSRNNCCPAATLQCRRSLPRMVHVTVHNARWIVQADFCKTSRRSGQLLMFFVQFSGRGKLHSFHLKMMLSYDARVFTIDRLAGKHGVSRE